MICLRCKTPLSDKALFCLHCGLPQEVDMLKNYIPTLDSINKIFHFDFVQLQKNVFQKNETPILSFNYSYFFNSSKGHIGYIVLTNFRYFYVSFEKQVDSDLVDVTKSSKCVKPDFSPLSAKELFTRHIEIIPFSYITSIHQFLSHHDYQIINQKKLHYFQIGTAENDDMAFGTRFIMYNELFAKKFYKTICHYNSKIIYTENDEEKEKK